MNDLEKADVALGAQLASQRRDPLVRSAAEIGKAGDQEPLYAVALTLIIAGILCRSGRLPRAGMAMGAAVGAADAGKTLAKRNFRRTRPHVLLDAHRYASEPGGSPEKPEQSFPSGHVAGTSAAARAIARYYPQSAPWTAAATVIIAAARLAKGAHWPLDVAAGLVIGIASEKLTSALLARLHLSPR